MLEYSSERLKSLHEPFPIAEPAVGARQLAERHARRAGLTVAAFGAGDIALSPPLPSHAWSGWPAPHPEYAPEHPKHGT